MVSHLEDDHERFSLDSALQTRPMMGKRPTFISHLHPIFPQAHLDDEGESCVSSLLLAKFQRGLFTCYNIHRQNLSMIKSDIDSFVQPQTVQWQRSHGQRLRLRVCLMGSLQRLLLSVLLHPRTTPWALRLYQTRTQKPRRRQPRTCAT